MSAEGEDEKPEKDTDGEKEADAASNHSSGTTSTSKPPSVALSRSVRSAVDRAKKSALPLPSRRGIAMNVEPPSHFKSLSAWEAHVHSSAERVKEAFEALASAKRKATSITGEAQRNFMVA